jgi:molybdopterin/thiamine biosynthesis adenylyltransferase
LSNSDVSSLSARSFADADHHYRPIQFRLADAQDRDAFDDLRACMPGLALCDRIHDQIGGLLQARVPSRRLSAQERVAAVEAHLGGCPADEYGVWVYYPWLRTAVHLLDACEFVELRSDRNRNRITREERDRLATKRVGVVGLSAGASIALTIALERSCGELRLADADTLELSNLNRLRAGLHGLGLPKAVLAARAIAEFDPYLAVHCEPEGIRPENVDAFLREGCPLDLVLEECDSLDVKLLVRERARELGIPVVMATCDRGMLDIERFDLEPGRPLLHGLVGDLNSGRLQGLTTAEKVPYVISILGGAQTMPKRMWDSFAEVGRVVETWPQLASAVTLSSGIAADACRRILLGQLETSGRHFVDLDELIRE